MSDKTSRKYKWHITQITVILSDAMSSQVTFEGGFVTGVIDTEAALMSLRELHGSGH